MFFSSIQEINRLISKGMSIIYLKVTIEKLRFSKFKRFVSRSVFGELHFNADIIEFYNFLLQLKNQRSGSKTVCRFFIILILEGIMTFQSC